MPNVQIALSVEEYSALIDKISDLTQKVKFYEDITTVLMEEYKAQMQECTGKDKSNTAGLRKDDEDFVQRIIKGKTIRGKLIDLRKKPPED